MTRRPIIQAVVGVALVAAVASLARGQRSPGPRVGGMMVYDEARRHIVMFGGRGAPGAAAYPNDLWAWDGLAWRELVAADSVRPPGRDAPHVAYDAARRRVVVFGGRREAADESTQFSEPEPYRAR